MRRALGLLLLSVEGTLTREASQWDETVECVHRTDLNCIHGGYVAGCPCDSTAHDCRPAITASMVQRMFCIL